MASSPVSVDTRIGIDWRLPISRYSQQWYSTGVVSGPDTPGSESSEPEARSVSYKVRQSRREKRLYLVDHAVFVYFGVRPPALNPGGGHAGLVAKISVFVERDQPSPPKRFT